MKKVGILTYHGLHNYGAMLQAFAMQTIIKKLGYNCEIINFRTRTQKKRFRPVFKSECSLLEGIIKMIFWAPIRSDILKKHNLFEAFLIDYLKLSPKEYSSLNELFENPPEYDYYISGSDQIWNPYGPSFDWAYFLPFVKECATKIAYAPSMVQKSAGELNPEIRDRIKNYLQKYDHISVREEESRINVHKISGIDTEVVLDPTFLIEKQQWEKYISPVPLVEGEYLFYYSPFFNPDSLKITRQLAKYLNLEVVTSIAHCATFMVRYPDFKKKVAVGPLEFLNLCANAKFICGQSLHLTAFSIILQKPFFITDGNSNKRINHLLNISDMNNRSVNLEDINIKTNSAFDIDYNKINRKIERQREKSINFLINSLQ